MTTGVGLTQWKKFAVERLPIPQISAGLWMPDQVRHDENARARLQCAHARGEAA